MSVLAEFFKGSETQMGIFAPRGYVVALFPDLSAAAKAILIVLMFLGRLGPISVFVALSGGQRDDRFAYPKEEVLIG